MDVNRVIKGLECHFIIDMEPCEKCPYYGDINCTDTMAKDALELLKAQNEIIDDLIKVGYPHNFQREEPWIVNYMYVITDVIRKAVNFKNDPQ